LTPFSCWKLPCGTTRLELVSLDDRMTEVVAMKIMELAKGGELDPERLCVAVSASLDGPTMREANRKHRGSAAYRPLTIIRLGRQATVDC
jgi:hypothetical protein